MEIIIQFVQTAKRAKAEELIQDKLDGLAKRYDWLIRADVFFKEEKAMDEKGKICDVRLSCPGPQLFASSNENTFEAAVMETISDLEIQLKKRKSQMTEH